VSRRYKRYDVPSVGLTDQHRLHRVAAGGAKPENESFWSAYWERFRALIR
jgi:hypothetical protein